MKARLEKNILHQSVAASGWAQEKLQAKRGRTQAADGRLDDSIKSF